MTSDLASKYFIPTWRAAPFLRIFIPLALGMVLANYGVVSMQVFLWVSVIATFAISALYIVRPKPLVAGILVNIVCVAVGFALVYLKDISHHPSFIGKRYQPGAVVIATLSEPPLPKEKSVKANATVSLLTQHNKLLSTDGGIILYLEKTDSSLQLDYGSRILFIKSLQPIRNAGNPGGFDYKTFAAQEGIYYQVFLKKNDYILLPGTRQNDFNSLLFRMRNWVLEKMETFMQADREKGVAEALLVGYRGDLDKSLVEQYANTGVVHIIAISGMHLGLIYGLLLLLLRPLGNSMAGRIGSTIIMLATIWIFSLLTGAAPSITRAAVMFSVVAIGKLLQRNNSIYNSLSVAAVMLLLIDPYALWNVGFQLSFAAVLSIAVFYQPIRKWYNPNSILAKHLWQMTAVTIAAQILTIPLGIYHFHQFPTWFLVANIVAVPLSGFALYAIIAMLALSWWPMAGVTCGWVAEKMVWALNEYILLVNRLPARVLGNIEVSVLQSALLYACIAALAWWWFRKSIPGLLAGIACGCFFLMLHNQRMYLAGKQEKLLVFNVPGHTAIDYIHGRQATFVGDSILGEQGFLQNFHLLPTRIAWQYSATQKMPVAADQFKLVQLGKRKIMLLNQQLDYKQSKAISADLLIVTNNVAGNPFRILKLVNCPELVVDGSNSAYHLAKWKTAADSLHLRLHSIPDEGAFVMDLYTHRPFLPERN